MKLLALAIGASGTRKLSLASTVSSSARMVPARARLSTPYLLSLDGRASCGI